jgi:hypothetical protein
LAQTRQILRSFGALVLLEMFWGGDVSFDLVEIPSEKSAQIFIAGSGVAEGFE